MLNITILAIGKLKEKHYQAAAGEYLKRLDPYAKIKIEELKAEAFGGSDKAKAKEAEGERLLNYLKKHPDSLWFVLDENGEELTSEDFALKLDKLNRHIIFIIGGSLGLDKRILTVKDKLSLSKMTLPHELVRVVLIEQLYRAVTIIKNKEYHY